MKSVPEFSSSRGSALIYVLIAVALLAALTVSMMEPSGQQAQSQNATNLGADVESQIGFITAAISECVIGHPDQDSGLTSTEQKNAPYPINPRDPYFTAQSADPGSDSDDNVEHIRCPGSPGGTGPNNQDHARIFGGASGKFLAPPPSLFDPWNYYNGADGVAIMLVTNKTDAAIKTGLDRLDDKFSECEAEVIDRREYGAKTISSDTTPGDTADRTCPAGSLCFRYWIILKKDTALHEDPDCGFSPPT